jgi:hypothetical protein
LRDLRNCSIREQLEGVVMETLQDEIVRRLRGTILAAVIAVVAACASVACVVYMLIG